MASARSVSVRIWRHTQMVWAVFHGLHIDFDSIHGAREWLAKARSAPKGQVDDFHIFWFTLFISHTPPTKVKFYSPRACLWRGLGPHARERERDQGNCDIQWPGKVAKFRFKMDHQLGNLFSCCFANILLRDTSTYLAFTARLGGHLWWPPSIGWQRQRRHELQGEATSGAGCQGPGSDSFWGRNRIPKV